MLKRTICVILLLLVPLPLATGNQVTPDKTIVLLDTSGSMRGNQLERAKQVILNTLEKRETDSEFEIYTFAEEVLPISSQDKSFTQLRSEISAITAGSRTSLYDSISLLIPIAENIGADIVVLSDGDDSQSSISLQELLDILAGKSMRISFLSEFIDPRFLASVENIVSKSDGLFMTSIPVRPLEKKSQEKQTESSTFPYPLALAITWTLFAFLLGNRFLQGLKHMRKRSADKEFLIHATAATVPQDSTGSQIAQVISKFSTALNLNIYLRSKREKSLFFVIFVLSIFLLHQALHSWALSTLLALTGSAVALRAKLSSERNRRIQNFERELPGALKMLAGSLSAGLSFLQALSTYADDGQGECAREFRRALAEIQLGIPIERALESTASRMHSEDLRWAVSAFAIQREVGGSLAAILKSTAETIDTRFDLRREVRTLSAEGRISSYILMALPIGIFLFLTLIRPDYVGFFLTEPIGNFLLIVITISLAAAWIWLKSLVRISV